MGELPVCSGSAAVTVFQALGWEFARQKGSHMILTRKGSNVVLSVPNHKTLDR